MARAVDLAGIRFGKLVALTLSPNLSKGGRRRWRCVCDCGGVASVPTENLLAGNSRSCGCLRAETMARNIRKHGEAKGDRSPEYRSWKAMRQRCNDKNAQNYHHYGGRGIRVCDRWSDFAAFLEDMGRKPTPKHTIERNDRNGHYEPSNCRWASIEEQRRNTSQNVYLTRDGVTMTMAEWSRKLGIDSSCLRGRLKAGWTGDRLFSPPRRWPGQ